MTYSMWVCRKMYDSRILRTEFINSRGKVKPATDRIFRLSYIFFVATQSTALLSITYNGRRIKYGNVITKEGKQLLIGHARNAHAQQQLPTVQFQPRTAETYPAVNRTFLHYYTLPFLQCNSQKRRLARTHLHRSMLYTQSSTILSITTQSMSFCRSAVSDC
jgi:hypothetical protein